MPPPDAGLETELKFEIDSAAAERLQSHPALGAAAPARHLRTVYFDTPRYDLKNHGVTLRVRECDGGFVQTVKRRHGARLFARDEWECAVPAAEPNLEAFARTPAAVVLNGHASELAQVFATKVDRRIGLWRQGDNIIEVSLDVGAIAIGDRREPIRELELELKAGEPSVLFDLARDLSRHAAMRLSFESKGERGYRMAGHDGAAAIKAEHTALGARITTGEAFRRVARSTLVQISANAELLARTRMGEAVHQTRVGLRRLRAALAAFKPIVHDEVYARIKAEARWLAGELDAARDVDVFLYETFRPAQAEAEDDAALAALGERLRRVQTEAYEQAVTAAASPRFSAFLLDAAAWVESGAWTRAENPDRERPAAEFGAAALHRLHRKLRRAGRRFAELEPAERHDLRIRAKKLRYAAEFFGSAFTGSGQRRRTYVAALKKLQDRLGALNDIAVARTLGPGFAGARSGELGFTAGLIVGRRERAEADLIKAAAKDFHALAQVRPFWLD